MVVQVNFKNYERKPQWDLADDILYNICDKYPNHTSPEEIMAKFFIIGRSYAVAIERRKKVKKDKNGVKEEIDAFYKRLGEAMLNFNVETSFDGKLKKLKDMEFGMDSIKLALELHNLLVDEIQKLTGDRKISLASKYIHFHTKNAPIYDSFAKKALIKCVPKKEINSYLIEFKKLNSHPEYVNFCARYLILFENNKESFKLKPKNITRQIDNYLFLEGKKD